MAMLEQKPSFITKGVTDSFWSDGNANNYYRLSNDKSKLYYDNERRERVDVSLGSQAHLNIANDKCSGTKVKENSNYTCHDFLMKCILNNTSNEIEKCKDYFKDKNFWDIVPKEVDEMIPIVITEMLDRFGFSKNTKNDIIVYENFGSWSNNLEKKINNSFTKDDLESIRNNEKLKNYLELLVNKINSNPVILNTSYNAKYNFDQVDYLQRFSDWNLTSRGITPRVIFKKPQSEMDLIRGINFIRTSSSSYYNSIDNNVTLSQDGRIFINGNPFNINQYNQNGGSIRKITGIPVSGNPGIILGAPVYKFNGSSTTNSDTNILKSNYSYLRILFDAAEKQLNAKGKSFDSFDKNKIEEYLNNFKNTEEKLHKSLNYIDKYIDCLEIYKQHDPENILKIDDLNKFIEAKCKYSDRSKLQFTNILAIFEDVLQP